MSFFNGEARCDEYGGFPGGPVAVGEEPEAYPAGVRTESARAVSTICGLYPETLALYQRQMQKLGISASDCRPEQFPVLTKKEVIENFDEIVTCRDITRHALEEFLRYSQDPKELFKGRYTVIHTSGSSGEVAFYVYDDRDWARAVAQFGGAESFDLLRVGRKRVGFFGATQGHFAGVTLTSMTCSWPMKLVYNSRFYEINRPLAEAVAGLNTLKPHVVIGYATALKALAGKQLSGELHIAPEAVASSGEPLLDSDREIIEKAFGKCVRNVYSCSEHGVMGIRESGWRFMRLLEDQLIFEVFPDHTLVTNIFNRTLPLIRYRMNDILVPVASKEHSPYLAVEDIVGRVEHVAKFVNCHGAMDGISPHTINELLVPHVRRFQMRLRGPDSFQFAVVLDMNASHEQRAEALQVAEQKLKTILRQKEMDNVQFEVLPVPDLPVDARTRKFRLIVPVAGAEA